jgi:hypothetical protein
MRPRLAVLLVAVVLVAGCGGGPSGEPTATGTPVPSTERPGPCDDVARPTHGLVVENTRNETVELRITVERPVGDEVVFERTLDAPPYDSEDAVPRFRDLVNGTGAYAVTVTTGNRTATYDWRPSGPCDSTLAIRVTEGGVRFVRYGEG